jgi:sugar transferase (PEP-CTERM/EpsH1 system associated)
MRILMLAHRLPYPPITGDKVRAYHVARHLARAHTLTLACPVDEAAWGPAVAALRQDIADLEVADIAPRSKRLTSGVRLLLGDCATRAYFDAPRLRARIGERLAAERFDLVYVSSSSMAQYAPADPSVPVVMDFVDVDSDKWLQFGARLPRRRAWVYRLEGRRLGRLEQAAAWRATHCLVTTRQEAELLEALAPGARITVVPNGVDLEYFAPASTSTSGATIVFTGAMDYVPNADAAEHFAREIFPRIRARASEARFLVVGRNPTRSIQRLATLAGVEVTGPVHDVRPFLRQATVAVAPLRIARGVQNKILEAMATGLPVVATSLAARGLEARRFEHLLVEDAAADFADAVSLLLGNPGLRDRMGRAGRRFVEGHHAWADSLATLDAVLEGLPRAIRELAPVMR